MRMILAEYNPRRNSIDVGVSKNKGKSISFHYLMGWKAHKKGQLEPHPICPK